MTGQIGFDEGGVLQALNTPLIEHTVTNEKKNKKGKVTTSITKMQVTGAQVLVLAVVYGLVRMSDLWSGVGGGAVEGLKEAAEGAGAWFETQTKYGLGFHMKWRGWNHAKRMKWRAEHGKAAGWMPPGYPGFWD